MHLKLADIIVDGVRFMLLQNIRNILDINFLFQMVLCRNLQLQSSLCPVLWNNRLESREDNPLKRKKRIELKSKSWGH